MSACAHCGLPAVGEFCCHGCRTVYEVIHAEGLARYYDLRRNGDGSAAPARTTDRSYDEFDDPAFGALYVRPADGGLSSIDLYLEGLQCAACVWLVERAPLRLAGVAEARLDLSRAMVHVVWDPRATKLSAIARWLDRLGYPAHPFRGVRARDVRRREDRAMLIKIAVAGAAAGNVMMLAAALYGGAWHGMAAEHTALFRWTSLLVALPSLWAASVFFRGAWGSVRARALHMDVPISLGILGGFAGGAWATVRGGGEIYFDSVTALVFLLLVGRHVQQRRQRAAADAAELLFSLAPSVARRIEDGRVREVPIEALLAGQRVEVPAGESIPVDGVVLAGSSDVDASLLTGESRPRPVGAGDEVHAGTLNLSSRLELQVTASGEDTRVARLARLVEDGARRRAPVVALADRVSAVFVVVVLALAAATFLLWRAIDPSRALDHAIAMLVVTCPCALGLATPLAVSAAIGRAGREGVLIRGGDALERLAGRGRVLLDKTGTLTAGQSRLVRFWGDERVKPLVSAAESEVAHPVARALVEGFGASAGEPAREVRRSPDGAGLSAVVAGHRLCIGSPALVARECGVLSAPAAAVLGEITGEGLTPVAIAVDGDVAAVAGIGDPLRAGARGTVERLRGLGWRVGILSGDDPRVVGAVARALGIAEEDSRGGAGPEDKLAAVSHGGPGETIVMVGDGVNDAAALSGATVGVAVRGGAEAALAVADVFLARDGVESLARLFTGARRTMAVIRRNLIFSLLYNAAGAALALAGLIGPLTAALLMPLSSLTVITHSYRARTF